MMLRRLAVVLLASFSIVAPLAQARSKLPVTTAKGAAADLVRKLWKDEKAAGNAGDFYDNRDREHAPLDVKQYPQLSKISYTEQEKATRRDYAGARMIRTNMIVFGNSSTASNVEQGGGSNTRSLYNSPAGAALLHAQYRANNLYAYPEHRDHDPGRNGEGGGYGDLFPINTAYVYTSQGSSSSEMPFVRAMPLTLAAFRPEVKKRLAQEGLLMPTVQMILRRTMKNVPDAADYLSGRAHPTVFESANVDDEAMVLAAQAITLDALPPLAQLQVVEEDRARAGVDYFDYQPSEHYADTPGAIGRIGRSVKHWRRMVVSADSSFDANARPLTWDWKVLRGDANRVRIKPLNARGSIVEIMVAHHERRPIERGSAMESSRVDIGCFVHNGKFFSPPAFVCFYFLESEARGYAADGELIDVGYPAGEVKVSVADWRRLFQVVGAAEAGAKFLKAGLSQDEWNSLVAPAAEYEELRRKQDEAAEEERIANKPLEGISKQDAEARKRAAGLRATAARKALADHLAPAQEILLRFVKSRRDDAEFLAKERKALDELYASATNAGRGEFDSARATLSAYGLFARGKGFDLALTPARRGRLTPFERSVLERLNAAAIKAFVLPGALRVDFKENYVAPNLAARKAWRDVYRYDSEGKMSGWTRYEPGKPVTEFLADGSLAQGGKVRYEIKPDPTPGRPLSIQWVKVN